MKSWCEFLLNCRRWNHWAFFALCKIRLISSLCSFGSLLQANLVESLRQWTRNINFSAPARTMAKTTSVRVEPDSLQLGVFALAAVPTVGPLSIYAEPPTWLCSTLLLQRIKSGAHTDVCFYLLNLRVIFHAGKWQWERFCQTERKVLRWRGAYGWNVEKAEKDTHSQTCHELYTDDGII